MGRMDGKIALVTGAAMGMGRTHAETLAREGATVVLTDIDDATGEGTAEAIRQAGGSADYMHHNVASEEEWKSVIDTTVAKYGKINVLVNNAGILILKPVDQTETSEWDKIFDINVKGTFFGIKHVLPAMQKAGGGSIVNISSIYGLIGAPSAAAYEASKGAVRLLTKATAIDYAPHKIRVNSVHPGVIDTPMTKDLLADPDVKQAILGTTILDRPAQPQEISNAVLFLASDEASFMTGSEMVVDGGYTAQ